MTEQSQQSDSAELSVPQTVEFQGNIYKRIELPPEDSIDLLTLLGERRKVLLEGFNDRKAEEQKPSPHFALISANLHPFQVKVIELADRRSVFVCRPTTLSDGRQLATVTPDWEVKNCPEAHLKGSPLPFPFIIQGTELQSGQPVELEYLPHHPRVNKPLADQSRPFESYFGLSKELQRQGFDSVTHEQLQTVHDYPFATAHRDTFEVFGTLQAVYVPV